jgi:hypothetical protein
MKQIIFLIIILVIATSTAAAQIELISGNFFPADLEFGELEKITSQESFEDTAHLAKVEDKGLITDVGFVKYAERVYSTTGKGSLSIEIFTLLDNRAAYSLLTLLRTGSIQDGPPGNIFTTTDDGLRFSQERYWVRIKAARTPPDLVKRIAFSISNRIGPDRSKTPSLVSHLPKLGLDRNSLRYYPGETSFKTYSNQVGGTPIKIDTDAEIAQAQYTLNGHTGTLSLISFPTKEIAEDFFAVLSGKQAEKINGQRTFAKKAGPIVGILDGPFDPGSADKILNAIHYSYSVKWMDDKGKGHKTVWGVPVGILSTVVKSLFFVGILFAASILVGIGFAIFRVFLKKRAPKRSPGEQDPEEMTRLRMR